MANMPTDLPLKVRKLQAWVAAFATNLFTTLVSTAGLTWSDNGDGTVGLAVNYMMPYERSISVPEGYAALQVGSLIVPRGGAVFVGQNAELKVI